MGRKLATVMKPAIIEIRHLQNTRILVNPVGYHMEGHATSMGHAIFVAQRDCAARRVPLQTVVMDKWVMWDNMSVSKT